MFGAIAWDRKILADKSKSDAQRLSALKYLGHWIGDLHQPLPRSACGKHSQRPARSFSLRHRFDELLQHLSDGGTAR
jgi:hypothetical protein